MWGSIWSMCLSSWPAVQDFQGRELVSPQRVLSPLARVQGSAPRNGHKVGMPLQASSPLSLSVSCDMATPCLAGWCLVHLSIAHVHITPCPIIH